MATSLGIGGQIVTDGLVLCLDAANKDSYPGSGTTWYDLSGNNRNATKGGSQSPTYPQFNSGGWFTFSGGVTADNYSRFDVALPQMDAVSAEAIWRSTVSGGHVFRLSNSDLQIGPDGFTAGNNYNDIRVTPNPVYNDNKWYIGQLTFDGQTLNAYLNGEFYGTESMPTPDADGIQAGTLRIGTRDDAYFAHFVGDISLIKIYNRALTAAEIQQNYNATKSRFGL